MSGFLRLRHKTKVISPEATVIQCAKLGARPPTPSAHLQGSPKDGRPQPLYLISFVSWFDLKLTVTLALPFLLGEAFLFSSGWGAKQGSIVPSAPNAEGTMLGDGSASCCADKDWPPPVRLSGGLQERCFLSSSPSCMHSQGVSVTHALQTRALCGGGSSQMCPYVPAARGSHGDTHCPADPRLGPLQRRRLRLDSPSHSPHRSQRRQPLPFLVSLWPLQSSDS